MEEHKTTTSRTRAINISDAMGIDEYAVLDVETTGLSSATERIIEIAILKVRKGTVVSEYHSIVNPERLLPKKITEITGITQKMVNKGKPYLEMCVEVADFLGDLPIVAHNSRFDAGFVANALSFAGINKTIRHIDTIAFAKKAFPNMKNYKLATLIQELNLYDREQTHRAMDDVTCTLKLFLLCKNKIDGNELPGAGVLYISAGQEQTNFYNQEYIHPLWYKKWLRVFFRTISTILTILGLICLFVVPVFGVVAVLIGVLFLRYSFKIEKKIKKEPTPTNNR